jgi:P-type conjugative transfer protein TrbG
MMRGVTTFAVSSDLRRMRSMKRCTLICATAAIALFASDTAAQATLPVQHDPKGAGITPCDSSVDRRPDRWDTLRNSPEGSTRMACDTAGHMAGRDPVGTVGGSRPLTDPVVAAAREYAKTGVARTIEQGAFETFPYGHAQPTVTCAPLRACVIELEAGESVLSKIAGDTQRWEIQLALAGTNGQTPLVVVKPHDCGLTTNLVLATTAGRIYDLTLDSPPCPHSGLNPHGIYVRHVRFYYPDALVESWAAPPVAPTTGSPATANISALNFAYRITPERHVAWIPIAVFDDGAHCYIKLPPGASHREAPALFGLAENGSKILLNYNLVGDGYVTDRVFRSAVLVVGEGGHERTVRVDNLRYDAGVSANAAISGDAAAAPRWQSR